MGGRDKLAATGRRPAAPRLDPRCASPTRPGSERIVLVAPAERAAAPRRRAAGSRRGRRRRGGRSAAPGIRRRRPRRTGRAGRRRARRGADARRVERPRGPRPRRRASDRARRARRARGRGRRPARRGHPGDAGRGDLKRIDGDRSSPAPWTGPASARPRRRRGAGGPCSRRRFARFPPDGPETWTDEAALLEACGIAVHAVPGDPANLKVTYPDDLARVAAHLPAPAARRAVTRAAPARHRPVPPALRVGLGEDVHPFGPGAPLVLGGIAFAGCAAPPRPLRRRRRAARGRGRPARRGRPRRPRPALPGRTRDAARDRQRVLLRQVVDPVADAGLAPSSLDLTIIGARPRLGARLPEMADAIARPRPPGRAREREGLDRQPRRPEGAGRAIAARARRRARRPSPRSPAR